MSQTEAGQRTTVIQTETLAKKRSKVSKGFWRTSFERFLEDKLSVAALVIFIILCIAVACAPIIAQVFFRGQDPNKIDLFSTFAEPSEKHVLGTDKFGRDVAVRLLYAGQVSLLIGFSVAAVSLTIGVALGLFAGYFGSKVDDGINAIVQILQNIPTLFLLIILSVLITPEWWSLAIILGVLGWTGITRQVRGVTLSLRSLDYVEASRVMGASNWRIITVHVLPNIMSIVLVVTGFEITGAMLGEAGLSFLGFGVRPPTASWGNMLNNSLEFYAKAPLQVLMPGVMIFITVLCVFLIADGLRDAFDPRIRVNKSH